MKTFHCLLNACFLFSFFSLSPPVSLCRCLHLTLFSVPGSSSMKALKFFDWFDFQYNSLNNFYSIVCRYVCLCLYARMLVFVHYTYGTSIWHCLWCCMWSLDMIFEKRGKNLEWFFFLP